MGKFEHRIAPTLKHYGPTRRTLRSFGSEEGQSLSSGSASALSGQANNWRFVFLRRRGRSSVVDDGMSFAPWHGLACASSTSAECIAVVRKRQSMEEARKKFGPNKKRPGGNQGATRKMVPVGGRLTTEGGPSPNLRERTAVHGGRGAVEECCGVKSETCKGNLSVRGEGRWGLLRNQHARRLGGLAGKVRGSSNDRGWAARSWPEKRRRPGARSCPICGWANERGAGNRPRCGGARGRGPSTPLIGPGSPGAVQQQRGGPGGDGGVEGNRRGLRGSAKTDDRRPVDRRRRAHHPKGKQGRSAVVGSGGLPGLFSLRRKPEGPDLVRLLNDRGARHTQSQFKRERLPSTGSNSWTRCGGPGGGGGGAAWLRRRSAPVCSSSGLGRRAGPRGFPRRSNTSSVADEGDWPGGCWLRKTRARGGQAFHFGLAAGADQLFARMKAGRARVGCYLERRPKLDKGQRRGGAGGRRPRIVAQGLRRAAAHRRCVLC